jgi:hypothetical protein
MVMVESKLTRQVCCGEILTGKTWSADDNNLQKMTAKSSWTYC